MEQLETSQTAPSQPKKATIEPVPLACLSCRRKHLKCDGALPVCARCLKLGLECNYTPSRRGYKGPPKKRRIAEDDAQEHASVSDEHDQRGSSAANLSDSQTVDWQAQCVDSATAFSEELSSLDSIHLQPDVAHGTLWLPVAESTSLSCRYIDSYYHNFHAAHPILLPKRQLYRSAPYEPRVSAVQRLIGAHYLSDLACDTLKDEVLGVLAANNIDTASKVQAYLLFAIVLHVRNEQDEAVRMLATAVDAALTTGMNKSSFAQTQGENDFVVEESLRRTWWELHIISCMFAALHQDVAIFRTSRIVSDVSLPCENDAYDSGQIPTPLTMEDFHSRAFLDDEVEFSSYCYRIEAVQLLGRVIALKPNSAPESIDAIDAALAGWVHHLPESKREVLARDGNVNELLFQAHMFTNSALIYLHLPRSQLLSAPINASTDDMTCAKRAPASAPASSQHAHAVKTIRAAHKLSALAALEMPVELHTPLFVCGIVLDAIVQLAACSIQACDCIEQHRDRITLAVGILKSLSKTWPIANRALGQVKAVARSVLAIGVKPLQPAIEGNDLDFDSIINENMFLGLASDIDSSGAFLGLEVANG